MNTIQLQDGGVLLYDDAFLTAEVADRYFLDLRDQCVWEQKPGIFGYMQPRLIASYGDQGITYRYSGTDNVALPWWISKRRSKRFKGNTTIACSIAIVQGRTAWGGTLMMNRKWGM